MQMGIERKIKLNVSVDQRVTCKNKVGKCGQKECSSSMSERVRGEEKVKSPGRIGWLRTYHRDLLAW